MQTVLYVLPESQQPLKLVQGTKNQTEISFILKNKVNELVDPPESMASWKTKSPYLIQRPRTNKGITPVLPKNKCYLCVEKKEHQRDNDDQPKYTVAAAKKREMDNSLMQFYFTPVKTLHYQSVSVQLLHTRIQNDCSEVEDDLSGQSALGGSPPPSPPIQQQPERGSATGTDSPNELKDFFELVGEDYIFPIQVNAEGI